MKSYDNVILNTLIDKYERSKSFIGKNAVSQSFSVRISDLFPKYADDSEYDIFKAVNEAVGRLSELGLITYKAQRNGVIASASLNLGALDGCYRHLNRVPKSATNAQLAELLNKYKNCNPVLSAYCREQLDRISENKAVRHFDGFSDFENVLKALSQIFEVRSETFEREFSVKVLGDSKAFERVKGKVISILYEYGDFAQKDTVLEELNIIRNPGHVYFKGAGKITVGGQTIDLSKLSGDMAISSSLLSSTETVKVYGDSVMTIENLTTFNSFSDKNVFAIYLGGYHNTDRRDFIRKVYSQNPDKRFLHYGDIDAGGFYILLHLRRKTEIPFKPYNMDITALKRYFQYTKRLTENDRKRLKNLLDSEYSDTVKYMLDNDCKLEQEAVCDPSGDNQ